MNFSKGDHLIVQRPLYTHHGLYIGDGEVIHYLQDQGIVITALEAFTQGQRVIIKLYDNCFSPAEAITRAKNRLHETDYSLLFNNCEHFVTWCKTGVSKSNQVKETSKELYGLLGINNTMQSTLLNVTGLFEKQKVLALNKKTELIPLEKAAPKPKPAPKPTPEEPLFFTQSDLDELLELGDEIGKELEDAMTSIETFFEDIQSQIDDL